jgi:glucose/arabinose dehydrogenase
VVSARLAGKHNLPVGLQTVRDVLFDLSGRLLVVDEGTGGNGRVLRMDQEGNVLEHAGCLPSPTHLIVVPPDGNFYLSCKDDNAVWRSTGGSLDFHQWLQDDHLDAPSGIALDAQGSLFVASRRGNAVYRYRADEVPSFEGVVMEHLKDHPEFLKLVPA